MTFFDFLAARTRAAGSLLCIGLDPREESASAARAACLRLIEAAAPYAAAFKPNAAFFERLGPDGWSALREVIAHVPEGIPVILDAKRGDIADTAEAYARSAFDGLGAHAITASPYLGRDSLAPFLRRPDRGAFVVCRTSNAGAGELQSLAVVGAAGASPARLDEFIAGRAQGWSEHDNLGLVVGATDPEALARVRAAAPDLWFLVPGVGAQGGDLGAALTAGLRADGSGMLISVSRAVAGAADPARAAQHLRGQINDLRQSIAAAPRASPAAPPTLAADLIASGCARFGRFTLKSGQTTPIYLDLRPLVSHPAILRRVAGAYLPILRRLQFDRLAGIPYAGLPIATAIALEIDRPLIYARREVKDYGTRAAVEGEFHPGESAVAIDDLATTGATKIETIRRLEEAGLAVRDVVVLIDREQGAGPYLRERGYGYHAVVGLRSLLAAWRQSGAIGEAQFAEAMASLAG